MKTTKTTDRMKTILQIQRELNVINENLTMAAYRLNDSKIEGSNIALTLAWQKLKALTNKIYNVIYNEN